MFYRRAVRSLRDVGFLAVSSWTFIWIRLKSCWGGGKPWQRSISLDKKKPHNFLLYFHLCSSCFHPFSKYYALQLHSIDMDPTDQCSSAWKVYFKVFATLWRMPSAQLQYLQLNLLAVSWNVPFYSVTITAHSLVSAWGCSEQPWYFVWAGGIAPTHRGNAGSIEM